MLITRPNFRARIPSHTGRVIVNRLSTLVDITCCHCSSVIRWNGASRVIPALLTRISTGPSSASTAAIPALQASASATSHLNTAIPVAALN